MARRLRVRYSHQSFLDLRTAHSYLLQRGFEFGYVAYVKWWQVWRWHQLWSSDYHMCRADEQILTQQMARTIKRDIENDLADERARGEMADAQGSGPCSP